MERQDHLSKIRQLHDVVDKLRTIEHAINRMETIVDKYKRTSQLLPHEKDQLLLLRAFISKEEKKSQDHPLVARSIRDFRCHILPVKFSSDYYHFLKKKMWHVRIEPLTSSTPIQIHLKKDWRLKPYGRSSSVSVSATCLTDKATTFMTPR